MDGAGGELVANARRTHPVEGVGFGLSGDLELHGAGVGDAFGGVEDFGGAAARWRRILMFALGRSARELSPLPGRTARLLVPTAASAVRTCRGLKAAAPTGAKALSVRWAIHLK